MYEDAANRLQIYSESLRLPYFFWLGLRGFVGASIWLFLPVSLMAVATRADDVGFGVGHPASAACAKTRFTGST